MGGTGFSFSGEDCRFPQIAHSFIQQVECVNCKTLVTGFVVAQLKSEWQRHAIFGRR